MAGTGLAQDLTITDIQANRTPYGTDATITLSPFSFARSSVDVLATWEDPNNYTSGLMYPREGLWAELTVVNNSTSNTLGELEVFIRFPDGVIRQMEFYLTDSDVFEIDGSATRNLAVFLHPNTTNPSQVDPGQYEFFFTLDGTYEENNPDLTVEVVEFCRPQPAVHHIGNLISWELVDTGDEGDLDAVDWMQFFVNTCSIALAAVSGTPAGYELHHVEIGGGEDYRANIRREMYETAQADVEILQTGSGSTSIETRWRALPCYWEEGGTQITTGFRFDRAQMVLDIRVPPQGDFATLQNLPDLARTGFYTDDSGYKHTVVSWALYMIEKGIDAYTISDWYPDQMTILHSSEIEVDFMVSLEDGPFRGVPGEDPDGSLYDYQAWDSNPEDSYWMIIGTDNKSMELEGGGIDQVNFSGLVEGYEGTITVDVTAPGNGNYKVKVVDAEDWPWAARETGTIDLESAQSAQFQLQVTPSSQATSGSVVLLKQSWLPFLYTVADELAVDFFCGQNSLPQIHDVAVGMEPVAEGGTLSRYTSDDNEITAWASDDGDVAWLEIWIDGVLRAAEGPFTPGENQNVNYPWDTTNLPLGLHDVEIRAEDDLGAQSVYSFHVNLQAPPPDPTLSVSPQSLEFTFAEGQDPDDQYISLTNISGGTLTWSAVTSDSRIDVYPASGTAPYAPQVRIDSSGFSVGTSNQSITISSPEAANSPITIPVHLTINSNQTGNERTPIADTYYYEGGLGGTYGAYSYLRVGSTNGNRYYSFVKFNVDNIVGYDIASATLKMYCSQNHTDSRMIVERLATDWTEGDSGNQLQGYEVAWPYESTSARVTDTGWVSWNVTSLVQGWADGGANRGIVISTDEVTITEFDYNQFDSRTGSNPPILQIVLCVGTPDLQISTPRPDNGATAPPFVAGQEIDWYVTVSNEGTGCAPDYDVDYYLGDNTYDFSNLIMDDTGTPLLGGETFDEHERYTFTLDDVGTGKYLLVNLRGTTSVNSYGPFEVRDNTPCAVTVTSPAGGESWVAGTTQDITWTTGNCGELVRIELLRGGEPCRVLASSTANTGSLAYLVEPCGEFGADYQIRVTDLGTGNSGTSDAMFSIIPEPFTEVAAELAGAYQGSVDWGDFDSDGDLDLLITGQDSTPRSVSLVYEYRDGTFHLYDAGLPGIQRGTGKWLDHDNDGDLDVLLVGYGIAEIFENNGGVFTDANVGFTYSDYCSADAGDYDNDGDLDIIIADSGGGQSYIYRNDGGTFARIEAGIVGLDYSSVRWGDHDGDGDLDVVLLGSNGSGTYETRLYENNAGIFVPVDAQLPGMRNGSVDWGDYDSDGDLDLLLAGQDTAYDLRSEVFVNSSGTFSLLETALPGVTVGSASWGDHDNNGSFDVLVTGIAGTPYTLTRIYAQNSGTFTDIQAGLPGHSNSSAAWGDFDGDNDLDVLLSGNQPVEAHVFRNNSVAVNSVPSSPANLAAVVSEGRVDLSWDPASDNETPASGLTYNLRVGTTPGGEEICSAMAIGATGRRLVSAMGNVQTNTSWHLNLGHGQYYWSVQAIDGSFAGSPFAAEQTFEIVRPPCEVTVLYPQGGETLSEGQEITLAWDAGSGCGAQVAIDLVNDGQVCSSIISITENDGELIWTVAGCGETGGYTVRVTDLETLDYGESPGTFDIQLLPFVLTDLEIPATMGDAVWGDYDDDGDMDVLLSGLDPTGVATRVLRNDMGVFTDIDAGLPGRHGMQGSNDWADFDGDGDLDLVLTGNGSATVYRNDDGAFHYHDNLTGVTYSDAAWGDIDNDGDPDLVVTGWLDPVTKTFLFRNDEGDFFLLNVDLPGVYFGSLDWGDYDNDGDLDLLVTGDQDYSGNTGHLTRIFRNEEGDLSETTLDLPNLRYSTSEWGDYDGDGDLDILLSGHTDQETTITAILENVGGEFIDVGAALPPTVYGTATWGDYDNDGDLDVLVAGSFGTRVVANDSGTFGRVAQELPGTGFAKNTWCDFDNDGDLDILLFAYDESGHRYGAIYENILGTSNSLPSPPSGLSSQVTENGVELSWAPASDQETLQPGLSYNIRLGTNLGDGDVVMPQSGWTTGYRMIQQPGNAGQRLSWTVKGLMPGTYFWSVQAVDGSGAGSAFAQDQLLVLEEPTLLDFTEMDSPLPDVEGACQAWGDYDNDGDLDLLISGLTDSGPVAKLFRNEGGGHLVDSGVDIPGVYNGAAGWGDLDQDGFLDFVLTGVSEFEGLVTQVMRNLDGDGTFLATEHGVQGVQYADLDFADVDNDGDLDLFLTGLNQFYQSSNILYENLGSWDFQSVETMIPSAGAGACDWADLDNDGDLDAAICSYETGSLTKVYLNMGNGVYDAPDFGLPHVIGGDMAFGDFDADGDQDLALSGYGNSGAITHVYENINAGEQLVLAAELTGLVASALAWGDLDNDGDLDLLAGGSGSTNQDLAFLFVNQGAGVFDPQAIPDAGGVNADVGFADFDGDGDLDLLITGEVDGGRVTKLLRNNFLTRAPELTISEPNLGEWTFSGMDSPAGFTLAEAGVTLSFSWEGFADHYGGSVAGYRYGFDLWDPTDPNDPGWATQPEPDPDLLEASPWAFSFGVHTLTVLCTDDAGFQTMGQVEIQIQTANQAGKSKSIQPAVPDIAEKSARAGSPNFPPDTPAGLVSAVDGNQVTLTWDAAMDDLTPSAGLTYNVRVGTAPGLSDVVPAMSDLQTGFRRVVAPGNGFNGTSFSLHLTAGQYTWSVQAVDNGYVGSAFASEGSFTVEAELSQPVAELGDVGAPRDVVFNTDGTLAFVAMQTEGIGVVDMSFPDQPQHFTAYENPSGSYLARGLCLQGDLLYVAYEPGALEIIDVSDPLTPVRLGFLPTGSDSSHDIVVQGTVAYLSDGNQGLQVIDVSDPGQPVITETVGGFQNFTFGFAVNEPYVYVPAVNGDLAVITLGAKDKASTVQLMNLGSSVLDARISGHYLFTSGDPGLSVLDVAEPGNPQLVSQLSLDGGGHGMHLSGGSALVANGPGGVKVIDITDPLDPFLKETLQGTYFAYDVAFQGEYALVLDYRLFNSTVLVFEPTTTGSVSSVFHVAETGSDGNDGSEATPLATIHNAMSRAGYGDEIIVAPGHYLEYGIYVTDGVTLRGASGSPADVVIDANMEGRVMRFVDAGPETRVEGLTLTNGVAGDDQTDGYGGGIHCQNSSPVIVNCIIANNEADGLSGSGYGGGLYSYGGRPVLERCQFVDNSASGETRGMGGGFYGTDFEISGATFFGNSATTEGSAIQVPGAVPSEVSTIANTIIMSSGPGPAVSCISENVPVFSNSNIFGNAGGDWTGLISDQLGMDGNFSTDPLFCGSDHSEAPLGIAEDSPCAPANSPNQILVGAVDVSCTSGVTSGTEDFVPLAYRLYPCVPNPFNPMTTIRFDMQKAGRVSLRILDVSGRLVATLLDRETRSAGQHEVVWRGQNTRGRQVAAGVYFYRMETDGFTGTGRMVLVK